MKWDLFISHASEDKDSVVRPLVEHLKQSGLRVWYDDDCIQVGDSIRRSIDQGLQQSRFGVVIVSPHSLEKEWPKKELDALMALEDGPDKKLLPIWHNITKADLKGTCSLLIDRHALSTASGLDKVAAKICQVVRGKSMDGSDANPMSLRTEAELVAELLCDGMVSTGSFLEWRAERLAVPPGEQIPLVTPPRKTMTLPNGTSFALPTSDLLGTHTHVNKTFYREVAIYELTNRIFRPTYLAVENRSETTAHDVLLELVIPKSGACLIRDESDMPQRPKRERNPFDISMSALRLAHNTGDVVIEQRTSDTVVQFSVDVLQPGRRVTSEHFMMAILESGDHTLEGKAYASVLSRPVLIRLGIRAEITKTSWTLDDIEAHANSFDTP